MNNDNKSNQWPPPIIISFFIVSIFYISIFLIELLFLFCLKLQRKVLKIEKRNMLKIKKKNVLNIEKQGPDVGQRCVLKGSKQRA